MNKAGQRGNRRGGGRGRGGRGSRGSGGNPKAGPGLRRSGRQAETHVEPSLAWKARRPNLGMQEGAESDVSDEYESRSDESSEQEIEEQRYEPSSSGAVSS